MEKGHLPGESLQRTAVPRACQNVPECGTEALWLRSAVSPRDWWHWDLVMWEQEGAV